MRFKTKAIRHTLFGLFSAVIFAVAFGQAGCATSSGGSTTQPVLASAAPSARTGQQLWDDNCARCHNSRPPEEYSAQQWAAITMHMRLRADLTGDEQRKVTKFLQASN